LRITATEFSFIERKYHREFSVRVAPLRATAYETVKQFAGTGRVPDKHAKGREPSASARRGEFVDTALKAVTRNATKTVRRVD
jgi:hypothetical protein